MLKNNKGISLIILIITVIVIVIISSTAIITIKSVTKDKGISYFINDLTEVRQFVVEYVGRDGTLPIKDEFDENNNPISAENTLIRKLESGEELSQIFAEDTGNYYFIDISKLGRIHLNDENRGYVLNEGTLNIYVINPFEYEGKKYYTLTSYLTGKETTASPIGSFEINILGNPITWTDKAEILVSIPDVAVGEADNWSFRWLKGSRTVDDFRTESVVNYFSYGDTITLTENGIYTIDIQNPEGKESIRKVVVSKIDDIPPTITMQNGNLLIDDGEMGIRSIRYKIKETANFQISEQARDKHPEYYTCTNESLNDTEEDLLNSYLWGNKKIKGNVIDNYLGEYEEYYNKYTRYVGIITNDNSSSEEIANAQEAIKVINNDYPQFAYDNRAFPNSEKNIVIYVEDLAGNGRVYSALSREEFIQIKYLSNTIESLSNASVLINNGDFYTNNTDVTLSLQAFLATHFFVTEEKVNTPEWDILSQDTIHFDISEGDGQKVVYAFFKDANGKIVSAYDTILYDKTPPSDDEPSVMGDVEYLTITLNQKDTYIVNGKETQSGLSGAYRIGVKKASESQYTWYTKARYIPVLEKNVTYKIVTEATDKAGNSTISREATFMEEE